MQACGCVLTVLVTIVTITLLILSDINTERYMDTYVLCPLRSPGPASGVPGDAAQNPLRAANHWLYGTLHTARG